MEKLQVGTFEPKGDEDDGKLGILEKEGESADSMAQRIFLVLLFVLTFGFLYNYV